jgi:hypothetical protein
LYHICCTVVPRSQSAKGDHLGTRMTRWEAGGDATRSTLLPLWEWLDSSEADAMPRCHPRTLTAVPRKGIVCSSSIPIRTLIPRAEQRKGGKT